MKTLILSAADIYAIVRHCGVDEFMDELIQRTESAFASFNQSQTDIAERTGFYYEAPHSGLLEWMPLHQSQQGVLMKMVGYHPRNPSEHDLPTIISTFSSYDVANGHLRALTDGTLLTALRTGAASAVATRLLARPDSSTVGLIGCGAQAVTQLHAISRLFDVERVLLYDIDESPMTSFRSRVSGLLNRDVVIEPSFAADVVAEADILCTATSVDVGGGPVFRDQHMQAHVHVNAVGSDLPGKTELPLTLLQRSFVCADHPPQARIEGECQQLDDGVQIPGLVQMAREAGDTSHIRSRSTVFDSTGWALEDQVVLEMTLQMAKELSIGTLMNIESIPADPLNPYDFLESGSQAGRTEVDLLSLTTAAHVD